MSFDEARPSRAVEVAAPRRDDGNGDLVDRVHKLRLLLAVMAQEVATLRRENVRLRADRNDLTRRLSEMERRVNPGN
jgi:hypothetical protein